jgi:hypothetical protein
MRGALNYFAPVIVFLSAIVGSLGPSREEGTSGLPGLTPFGWSMLALASTSFIFAIYGIYSREMELNQARTELRRIRSIATSDLRKGLAQLFDVLDFAVLVPCIAYPAKNKLSEYVVGPTLSIDLKSQQTITELEDLILEPHMKLQAPYIRPIPFGTDSRFVMDIIAEESAKAKATIDSAIQKYAARAITADVFEAGSKLLNEPFITYMINLRGNWNKRSTMEDSTNPKSVNLRMIGSGVSGGSKSDYLAMIDSLDRFRAALDSEG